VECFHGEPDRVADVALLGAAEELAMPVSLSLVIDAVDLVEAAAVRAHALDLGTEADRLLKAHSESDASKEELVDLLQHEQAAVSNDERGSDR
jgi:hypothetical protein